MSLKTTLAVLAGALVIGGAALAQDVPREQNLIVENPNGTMANPDWFNLWTPAGTPNQPTGLHQLAMDTFWYIDPDHGLDGVWDNSLAAEAPTYNDDFTQMTVRLREGIHWSDGVEFTADDVVFTTETHMNTNGLTRSAAYQVNVESVEAPDPYTVIFNLKRPNSRFHSLFTVRWNAAWMMPKHIFEDKDPLTFNFNPPVSLGAYTLHNYDPNGQWFTWAKREDWERTTIARFGEPGPQYVTYVDPGPPDRRVIAQMNHELDIIHDVAPEGMFTLARESPSSVAWFDGFPYAHPDPTLPSLIFNHQNEKFQDPRVRWALALAIDIRAVSMASYRGAATISAIAIPPTGTHPEYYHKPLEDWLDSFELDTGQEVIRPYQRDVGQQIADMLRPSMGDAIPSDPEVVGASFGLGWWRQDLEAAAQLLESAGFTRRGNEWYMPDGERFSIRLMVEGDGRPVMTRAGTMVAQQWREFGIDATPENAQAAFFPRRAAGDFEVCISWSVETWGGHPDLSFFLDSWHSDFVAAPGEIQAPRNWQRWSSPELDAIIEQIREVGFDDPKGIELGHEFIKLAVREMPVIPIMSYNVFTVMDETYWTGYPTAADPYTNPVPNWANSRYMMVRLRPTQQ